MNNILVILLSIILCFGFYIQFFTENKKKSIIPDKVRFFIISLSVCLVALNFIWCRWNRIESSTNPDGFTKLDDVFVEFHGLFFDLILFGIILTIYEYIKEKKSKIQENKDIINDFRDWKEQEATYRIMGAYSRILEKGYNDKFILSGCYFESYKFFRFKMDNVIFNKATIKDCQFYTNDLTNCRFNETEISITLFYDIKISDCTFSDATMINVTFNKIIFEDVKFDGVDLTRVRFMNTDLSKVDFENAIIPHDINEFYHPEDGFVAKDWFEDVERNEGIKGVDELRKKYAIARGVSEIPGDFPGHTKAVDYYYLAKK